MICFNRGMDLGTLMLRFNRGTPVGDPIQGFPSGIPSLGFLHSTEDACAHLGRRGGPSKRCTPAGLGPKPGRPRRPDNAFGTYGGPRALMGLLGPAQGAHAHAHTHAHTHHTHAQARARARIQTRAFGVFWNIPCRAVVRLYRH